LPDASRTSRKLCPGIALRKLKRPWSARAIWLIDCGETPSARRTSESVRPRVITPSVTCHPAEGSGMRALDGAIASAESGAAGANPARFGAGSADATAATPTVARTVRVQSQRRVPASICASWRASDPVGWCDIGDLLPRFRLVGGTWGWIAPVDRL
jgi:hypothetical protein